METAYSRGYLHGNYRLFHSSDRRNMDFESHFHDFHKIVFCLRGQAVYTMEGTTYRLRPWDILVIPEHQIHRSEIRSDEVYERMILFISDDFLKSYGEPSLTDAIQRGLHRPEGETRARLAEKLKAVEAHQRSDAAGHGLLADTYLLQFVLELGQMDTGASEGSVSSDPRMDGILAYINGHLAEEMSVDALAKRFFISPSQLMHSFKKHTGCSVHRYIAEKRLICAAEKIRGGEAVMRAAELSGFADYTAFLKAFRKQYGCAPGAMKGRK